MNYDDYKPSWWCPGAHFQTIFARFFRPAPDIPFRRERVATPDGDFVDLDWLPQRSTVSVPPLALLLHGLEGSSSAPYIQSMLAHLGSKGWNAVVLNFRGCSGEANLSKTTYHSGHTADLDWVVSNLRKTHPEIYLIGYSIGGNVVLKWLGEKGADAVPLVKKACAVSVPYDLVLSVKELDQGFNKEVYTRTLLRSLKKKMILKASRFPDLIETEKVLQARTFREFDREVTARLNGFENEMDYWTRSSSLHYLDRIRIPALLVHAKDDPFFPGSHLPYEAIEKSKWLTAVITEKGGHLGFVSGRWPWNQNPWLEKTIVDFMESEKTGRD